MVLQGACMRKDRHGRSHLLLKKQHFSYFFFYEKLQMRALKLDACLKIFGNIGRVCIVAFQQKTAMMVK